MTGDSGEPSAAAGRAARRARGAARLWRLRVARTLAALALCGSARAAEAAPPGCADSSRCLIPSNHYSLDLYQGVLLAPIRVTGIAGAYAGYAEGIEGMVANAAAPAIREPSSVSWFDFDVSASVSLPITLFKNDDFDNSGQIDFDYSNFLYITGGGILQVGPLGFGANGELQRYTLTGADQRTTHVTVGKYHLLTGVRLFGDQLMLGGGARIVTLGIDAPQSAGASDGATLTIAGIAPEVGFLIRPDFRSFRLGATFRFPVDAGGLLGAGQTVDTAGNVRAGDLVLPDAVVLPWELEVGVAVQVGPRPLNPEWIDPHDQEAALERTIAARRREREERRRAELLLIDDAAVRTQRAIQLDAEEQRARAADDEELRRGRERLREERRARSWNWPREHLLVTAELLVTGAVPRGVSLERFLGQSQSQSAGKPSVIGTSGGYVNYSPRFGIETEPVPGWVHTRFGSYYEPNRFNEPVGRQHFTFGADLRLFRTTFWGLVPPVVYKAQTSIDLAPRYQSVSLGLGVWR